MAIPAITGILGLLGGLFGNKGGTKDQFKQIPTLTPEQQQLHKDIFGQFGSSGMVGQNYQNAQGYLNDILSGDSEAYQRFAAPYERQFQEETIPGLSQQFAGYGGGMGGGLGSSSGFAQSLGSAAARHKSDIANLYANIQQNAASQAFGNYGNLANLIFGVQGFQNAYQPGNIGFGAQALAGLSSGIGTGAGKRIGIGLAQRIANALNKTPEAEKKTGVE